MTDREKLIDLLKNGYEKHLAECKGMNCRDCRYGGADLVVCEEACVADYLIANGVTVGKVV